MSGSSSSSTKSALVVDDDPTTRKIHKMLLTSLGFQTKDVENGEKAVDLCKSGVVFNLILMDMEMPVMDGKKATEALRKLGIGCKVIGVSANENGSERQEFIEAGLNEIIMKPLDSSKLRPFI